MATGTGSTGASSSCRPGFSTTSTGDDTLFEQGPLGRLADRGQLSVYLHHGFWQPVDTFRELHLLEELWDSGDAPWRTS